MGEMKNLQGEKEYKVRPGAHTDLPPSSSPAITSGRGPAADAPFPALPTSEAHKRAVNLGSVWPIGNSLGFQDAKGLHVHMKTSPPGRENLGEKALLPPPLRRSSTEISGKANHPPTRPRTGEGPEGDAPTTSPRPAVPLRTPAAPPPRRRRARAATWQRGPPPASPLPGTKSAAASRAGGRRGSVSAGAPTKRPAQPRRGEAGGAGSLFSVGRRPPPPAAPQGPPQPIHPQGPPPASPAPSQRTKEGPCFLRLLGLRRGRRRLPPAKGPLRCGPAPGNSHTSPPGGRSAGLLRLGWSRANGWAPPRPASSPLRRARAPPRSSLRTHPRRAARPDLSPAAAGTARGRNLPLGRQREGRTKGKNFQGPEARRPR